MPTVPISDSDAGQGVEMSINYVTVQATWSDQALIPTYAAGEYQIIAAGSLMSSSGVAIAVPVLQGRLAQSAPSMSVPLLASDSFPAGYLTWDFHIAVAGIARIDAQKIPVNFANGPVQGLFAILAAAGWNPGVNP